MLPFSVYIARPWYKWKWSRCAPALYMLNECIVNVWLENRNVYDEKSCIEQHFCCNGITTNAK